MLSLASALICSMTALQATANPPAAVEPGYALIIAVNGTVLQDEQREFLREIRPGGVVLLGPNIESEEQTRKLVHDIKKCVSGSTGLGDLPLIYIDQEGGRINRLKLGNAPSAGEIGSSNDEEYAKETGNYYGREAAVRGIGVVLAPVLDLCDPGTGGVIGDRSFGEDPKRTWRMGRAFVTGVREGGALPVIKHFPGHGGVSGDSHKQSVSLNVSHAELHTELEPFCNAVDENIPALMVGHIACEALNPENPKEPASLSWEIITGFLRSKWGYDGLVITDDLNMKGVGVPLEAAVVKSLRAGCDAAMICDGNPERLRRVVQAVAREAKKDPRFADMMTESLGRLNFFRSLLEQGSEDGPAPQVVSGTDPGKGEPPAGMRRHVVQQDETLWDLHMKYGVAVEAIKHVNNMDDDKIKVGKTILIPPKY